MPLNLIGLLQASRLNPAPGQSFKSNVTQAATGVAMSDYLFGTPFTTQSIQGVSRYAGRLTPLALTYANGTTYDGQPLPCFAKLVATASYVAGAKLPAIYDASYVAGDQANQVIVETVAGEVAGDVQAGYSYVNTRSVSVNTTTQVVTAEMTFNNNASYTTPVLLGSQGFKYIGFRVGVAPEPYFNLRAYTGTPGTVQGYGVVTVKPYRQGQPTPDFFPTLSVQTPSTNNESWQADNGYTVATWGDFQYAAEQPGNPTTNYYLKGYRLRPAISGTWFDNFNTDYAEYQPQIRYEWLRKVGETWVSMYATTRSQVYQAPDVPLLVEWSYPNLASGNTSPNVATIEVRFTAQIVSPFTSPTPQPTLGQVDYTVTVPAYTVVGSGGPLQ